MIRLTIPGPPVPQARPRVVTRGGRAMTYTPRPTVDQQDRIRDAYQGKYGDTLTFPQGIPLRLTAHVYRLRPKSWRRAQHWTTRPDASNLLKLVEDALDGLAFHDDAQVVEARVHKLIAAEGEPARTEIAIEEVV